MRKGDTHTAAARDRIARGTRWAIRRRQRMARIAPGEILALQRSGTLSKSLQPFAALAVEEAFGFIQALGGDEEGVSEQRMALVQDAARAGLVLRALMAKTLQGDDLDGDAISKICSLINSRRSNLVAIGIDRVSRELDIGAYVSQRDAENRAQATIDAQPEPVSKPADAISTTPTTSGTPGSSRSGAAETNGGM